MIETIINIFAVIILAGVILAGFIYGPTLRRGGHRPYRPKTQLPDNHYDEQKARVEQGGYGRQRLLNRTETVAYKAIWSVLFDLNLNRQYIVFAQVSLGEVLSHPNKQLYFDINSKRIDFLLTDRDFTPVLAIEIQGQGHYQDDKATKRDMIKRTAMESAGIDYISIALGDDQDENKVLTVSKVRSFFVQSNEVNHEHKHTE